MPASTTKSSPGAVAEARRGPAYHPPVSRTVSSLRGAVRCRVRVRLWQDAHGSLHAAALLLDDCILVWRTCPAQTTTCSWRTWAPGWIEFVGVARAQRGRGIGRALTLQLLRAMRAERLTVALLTTGELSLAARRLFAHCGFQTRHAIDWFVRDLATT
jgi:GNAT superfamily N-acetyltransferase